MKEALPERRAAFAACLPWPAQTTKFMELEEIILDRNPSSLKPSIALSDQQ